MKVGNLYEGQVIKNYKEACKLLGEKIKMGKSKQLQIQEWSRFFEMCKEGHKIIITKIFDVVMPKQDGRVTNGNHDKHDSSTYKKDLYDCILYYFQKSKKDYYFLSWKDLLIYSGILQWWDAKRQEEIKNRFQGDLSTAYQYYKEEVLSRLRGLTNRVLNSMQEDGLITYKKAFTVVFDFSDCGTDLYVEDIDKHSAWYDINDVIIQYLQEWDDTYKLLHDEYNCYCFTQDAWDDRNNYVKENCTKWAQQYEQVSINNFYPKYEIEIVGDISAIAVNFDKVRLMKKLTQKIYCKFQSKCDDLCDFNKYYGLDVTMSELERFNQCIYSDTLNGDFRLWKNYKGENN